MGKILFFGGKGGVGKTSCSSSFALAKAKEGNKTLLVSTDPAHSISDLFNIKIGSREVEIASNLFALEIDPELESSKYIENIKGNLSRIVSPIILDEMNRQLDAARVSPGSHESALFDKMIEIIVDKNKIYDYIIFDTAPTGHTVRLLSLPELIGGWINSLLKKRRKTIALRNMKERLLGKKTIDDDPVIKILTRRKENMELAREIMIDKSNLSFVFVINAERLPIEETKKAMKILQKYKIPVNMLVVNRILPENSSDEFWINKKKTEKEYLLEIEKTFKMETIFKIPLFSSDMKSDSIKEMSNYFSNLSS